MFGGRPLPYGACVQVELRVKDREPLAGEVLPEGGTALPFVGWLGLLSVLSDVLRNEESLPAEDPAGS
jgi:hypothetical protein